MNSVLLVDGTVVNLHEGVMRLSRLDDALGSRIKAGAAPASVEQAEDVRGEPWCYGVESTHSGDVVVRDTFDCEDDAQLHARLNGGIVVALYAVTPNAERKGPRNDRAEAKT